MDRLLWTVGRPEVRYTPGLWPEGSTISEKGPFKKSAGSSTVRFVSVCFISQKNEVALQKQ